MTWRLTRRAEADIIEIYIRGVQAFGLAEADAYHRKLEQAFQLLAQFPQIAPERAEIDPPVRIHPCGSHIIIYRAAADGEVLIIRVRHSREDWISDPADHEVED
ncbi:type II toxin-antitoxin system RelE/ParE family toxin [Geminicoccaceae bacterium 1502E]|nr:type II toxin-antitoxin system RelE/ParE family toxin [Geminicoccaceae bacterium 1502E]